MNTTKLYTIIIVGILLVLVAYNIVSQFEQPKIPASVRSVGDNIETDDKDRAVSPCLPPASTDTLLSVDINGIEDCRIPVSSTFDISWKTDNSVPLQDKQYNFVVFTLPNTVRFNGSGFLMLPPKVKLPFGFKFAPDKMRVLFPLYLLDDKTQGTFQVKPLVAGDFTLKWAYVVVNESGEITFSSSQTNKQSQSITFNVVDENPVLVVQDRVGMKKPEKTYISPSKEYELRVFKDQFQVLYAATGELVLERTGKNPNFSPGSRFLGYFPVKQKSMLTYSINIIDLLDKKNIFERSSFQAVAWGKNDSFLIIGIQDWGRVTVVLPWLEENNHLVYRVMPEGCHACDAWQTTHIAIDIENSLVRFRNAYDCDYLQNLLNEKEYSSLGCNIKESEYQQLLQSHGFPILKKQPKAWKLEEGLKISHIGILPEFGGSNCCNMNNFSYHPILKEKKLTTKNTFFEKQESVVRGNVGKRGRVLRTNTNENIDLSRNVLERLAEIDIFVQKNYVPLEQSDWLDMKPKQNGKEIWPFEYKKDYPVDSEIID